MMGSAPRTFWYKMTRTALRIIGSIRLLVLVAFGSFLDPEVHKQSQPQESCEDRLTDAYVFPVGQLCVSQILPRGVAWRIVIMTMGHHPPPGIIASRETEHREDCNAHQNKE